MMTKFLSKEHAKLTRAAVKDIRKGFNSTREFQITASNGYEIMAQMIYKVRISQLAALAECVEGVDMKRVYYYRTVLRADRELDPIIVSMLNKQDYHVISDGHHRTLACYLERVPEIPYRIDTSMPIQSLSWRWPRIAPLNHTFELLRVDQ